MEAEKLAKTTKSSLLSFQLVETIEKISDITFAKYMEKVSKTLFIIPADAHYYKFVEMLNQFKSYPTCERTPTQQADMPP
jgi:hypothetical protein